jgi:hypothetical protein
MISIEEIMNELKICPVIGVDLEYHNLAKVLNYK